MTQNFRVVRPEPPPDDQQRAAEALPKRRIAENAANSGRIAGNAKWIVARRSSWGYPPRRCIWCNQPIEPGTLYVQQDRWLMLARTVVSSRAAPRRMLGIGESAWLIAH